MSADMRQLKQFASSRLTSFKGYLAQKDPRPPSPSVRAPVGESASAANTTSSRQSWSQWAGDKLKRRNQGNDIDGVAIERMSLFPGWAARRFHDPRSRWPLRNDLHDDISSQEISTEAHFDVEIFVSGYASRLNNPDCMSRSQRAFLRLAKGFASLPKLQANPAQVANALAHPGEVPLSKSTEDLLASVHLPPPPSEMSEAAEAQALEEQYQKLNSQDDTSSTSNNSSIYIPRPRTPSASSIASTASSSSTNVPTASASQSAVMSNLHELHANLEARLQPFWSSAIANRTVRLSVYASAESASVATTLSTEDHRDSNLEPILTREVTTGSDGSFTANFYVPWDSLCVHPLGLHIAFGDIQKEHDFYILAELLPLVLPPPSPREYRRRPAPPAKLTPVFATNTKVPLTFAPVRVISDIDDTVKMANVLSGARAVFNTVFVQRLADITIPGMGEWYTDMWERGVRFHYVSNGPYEILPVVNEFFQLARLPPGSIKLRSYGGRSLFNGLLSAPVARKRQGVIDLLESFPESQFILVGDSGEQDLELYASVSAERPRQVLAVFIRDVRSRIDGEDPKPLEDPTGARAASMRDTGTPSPTATNGCVPRESRIRKAISATASTPRAMRPISRSSSGTITARAGDCSISQGSDYQPARNEAWVNGQIAEEPEEVYTPGGSRQRISDSEWKRLELQRRVDKARVEIPDHIPFRVFRSPEECTEAKGILNEAQGPRVPLHPEKKAAGEGVLIDI